MTTQFPLNTTLSPELPYRLALLRTPEIGAQRFAKLVKAFPQLAALFQASTKCLQAQGLSEASILAIKNPPWAAVEKDLRWVEQQQRYILTLESEYYPFLLRQIADPPPLLFVAGDVSVLQAPQLAIVGSRNPTPTGLELAQQFAGQLAQAGLTITSGLALGIDAASHKGALACSQKTIAVLGCGLDNIYPKCHQALAEKIITQGALLSEFPIGVKALAKNFPQRNRIVSGLSLGVLVVEATLRSGSLITARLANEQGREVFAIPGSILSPLSQGCHELIQQGAKLAKTAADILVELDTMANVLSITNPKVPVPNKNLLDAPCSQLLECIGYETTSVDKLVARTGLAVQTVISGLSILELQGHLTVVPGGYTRNH